jgi:hypothetical protein
LLLRFLYRFALCVALIAAGQPARAADDGPDPIRVTDPRLGEILFHFYQDDYVPAIVRLQAALQQGQLGDQAAGAELLLGDMLLSVGHHVEAADVFEHLQVDNVDRETRDRAWFSLARNWHRRGYLVRAQEALHHMSEILPDDLGREARLLQARIYIDSGQNDRAIALLQAWDDTSELASYARYNLSVALLRHGRVDAAVQNLDALGNIEPANDELRSLRDKANLALGYSLLQDEQPQAAKAALQRVRLDGPFSNKALLGVGWADARLGNYERALVPWMKLRDRGLPDPAVLESMLAVPYALAELDSIAQAANDYRSAIETFDEETVRIDRTIAFLESDESFDQFLAGGRPDSTDAYWQFGALPQMPEARYLVEALATNEFQEGLRNYRDLNELDDNLDGWQQDVDVYASVLESRQQAYARMLPRVQDTLAGADLDNMLYRQRRFAALLDNIERFNDWLALADEHEFDSWRKVSSAAASPVLAADTPEAEQLRYKVRMLKGMLQWELERNAEARLHRAVGDLRQVGEVLAEAERARDRIERDMRMLPVRLARLGEQINGLEQRIEAMRMRVADTLGAQRAVLQSITVGELVAQQERLRSYTLQARLALAAIYELPASSGGD